MSGRAAIAAGLVVALAAVLWWLFAPGQDPVPDRAVAPPPPAAAPAEVRYLRGYDFNAALDLSGRLVPAEVDEYYFLEVRGDRPDDEFAIELAGLMRRTSDETDYLGITGADISRTRAVFLDALGRSAVRPLDGATLIYIGDAADEPALREAAEASGARFLFGVYQAPLRPEAETL